MLNFTDILAQYPLILQHYQDHILKEYLQYHILESIFTSPVAEKLCFIGGTALRLVYNNQRFSEDLDFDNKGLSFDEFDTLMSIVQRSLELQGFVVELRTIQKGAYHCLIKFPDLLYKHGLSPMKTSKILIQIDTHDQGYEYVPDKVTLEKFETMSLVNVASKHLLLAQKIYTVFERKRMKGRDFFDILFLLKHTKRPDRGFLEQKLGIATPEGLTNYLLEKSQGLDFKALQADVQPFLFEPSNQSVALFPEYIKQVTFE